MTQADLADVVHCAAITVRKIESDERRPSEQMAAALAAALQIDASERERFVAAARAYLAPGRLSPADDGIGAASLRRPPYPILGRAAEIEFAEESLAACGGSARLLTPTGPPGVGKTRLATEIATRVAAKADVAVVFVELATAVTLDELRSRIANAVAVPAAVGGDRYGIAVRTLGRSPVLLVLDNFEQLVQHAGLVADLLDSCPQLSCIVTSRIRLDIYGELEVGVQPLPIAVAEELFAERARSANPQRGAAQAGLEEAAAETGTDATVTRICQRVDCLPLAIELAARRVRDLPLAVIDQELSEGLRVLGTGPRNQDERQRTMTSAVEWSYSLLGSRTQQLLRAVSVAASEFGADDAAAFADLSLTATEAGLTELVDHGLIRRVGHRFANFEVVRAVASERLFDMGEATRTRHRHAQRMATVLDEARDSRGGALAAELLLLIDERYDDLRAALDWCLTAAQEPSTGRVLTRRLAAYWLLRGLWDEGFRWSRLALDSAEGATEQAGPALALGILQWSSGDTPAAIDSLELAIGGARAMADTELLADALGFRALIAMIGGDLDGAEPMLHESREAYAQVGELGGLALTEMRLGRLACIRGDLDGFEAGARRALELYNEQGSAWGAGAAGPDLAEVQLARGDAEGAIRTCLQAMDALQAVQGDWHAAAALTIIANALVESGRPADAARVCGVLTEWHEQMAAPIFPIVAVAYQQHRDQAEQQLGARFAALHDEGRALPHTAAYIRELAFG